MFQVLNEAGLLTRLHSYVGLAGLHAGMVLLSTLCFMPKDMFVRKTDASPPSDPPRNLALRKRRGSLYDWSEIKVRTRHHSLSCRTCDDNSSDGDQREQLAMNGVLALQAVLESDALEDDGQAPKEHCINGDAKPRKSSNASEVFCLGEYSKTNGGPSDRNDFPSFRKIITRNSPLAYSSTGFLHAPVEDNMKPFFHSQGGLSGLRSSISIPSISGTLEERQQRNIKAITIRGRFVSIIDVTPLTVKTPRPQAKAFSQLNGNLTAESESGMWKPETQQSLKPKIYQSWKPQSHQSWKPQTDQSWKPGENGTGVVGPVENRDRLNSNLRAKGKGHSHYRVHLDVEDKEKRGTVLHSSNGLGSFLARCLSFFCLSFFPLYVFFSRSSV